MSTGLVPIAHSGHDLLPFDYATTTGAKETKTDKPKEKRKSNRYTFRQYPTLNQRKWIARNKKKGEQLKTMLLRMLDDKSIVHHECQQTIPTGQN